MHVNFYKKPQIKSPNTPLKIENSVLFLDYLEHFISNSATKRVQGYGTVGVAHNTIPVSYTHLTLPTILLV